MAYEKKKILLRRVVLGILLLIGIIVPICLANKTVRTSASGIVIKEDSGNVIDYYQYTDVSACKIELIFNMPVESVYAEVAFYDENNVFLAKEEQEFFGEDDRVSSTFYIDGQVDSYEIISYYCESHNDIVAREFVPIAFIPIDIILFALFISSLFLFCKICDFNGTNIIAYSGWYHHYIKINGEIADEHNTLIFYAPIILQCTLDGGDAVEAKISLSGGIALKINNKLYH